MCHVTFAFCGEHTSLNRDSSCAFFVFFRHSNFGIAPFLLFVVWETIDTPSNPLSSTFQSSILIWCTPSRIKFFLSTTYLFNVIFQWIEPLILHQNEIRCLNVHHETAWCRRNNLAQWRHKMPIYYGWRWHGMLTTERQQYSENPGGTPRQCISVCPWKLAQPIAGYRRNTRLILNPQWHKKAACSLFLFFICAGALCKILDFIFSYYGN